MQMKVAAALLTFVINVVIGIAVGFFLLVAMNGYSESDATLGLAAYVLTAISVSLTIAAFAFILTGWLAANQMNSFASLLIAVLLFSVIGAVLKAVCGAVGIAVAEIARHAF